MARSSRTGGSTGGPANVEVITTIDGFDRIVTTAAPADGTDGDSLGGLTEAAPGTDTASSGLNGRLQRIAQRLSSLLAVTSSLTPGALTNSVVVTGGTAVVAIAGPINGGFITNPANETRQGIAAAEPIYIDMVASPGSTDAAANGTTVAIDPAQTFTLPALATGVNVRVNAATNGHKFSGEKW